MWEYEEKPADPSGAIIGIALLPVYLLIRHFGNSDEALASCVCLGINLLFIKLNWDLRAHVWFWVVVTGLLLLHVPLIFKTQLPHRWIPGIALLPIGLMDFAIYVGVIKFVSNVVFKTSLSD
jgi:hypothetical protein